MTEQPQSDLSDIWATEEALSVLLIFPPEDTLLRRLAKAAESFGLACDIACASSCGVGSGGGPSDGGEAAAAALTKFSRSRHQLVLLDRRDSSPAAADNLLRAMKSVAGAAGYSAPVFVAVTKSGQCRGSSLGDLLQIGYDKKIKEDQCDSVDACIEVLLSLQKCACRHQQRLGSLAVVLTALGNCTDAVEITDCKFGIQYVNAAHEKMFGYAMSDLAGRNTLDTIHRHSTDRVAEETTKNLTLCLKRGKAWDGILTGRRKSGTSLDHYSAVYPVRDCHGSVHRFVWLRRSLNGGSVADSQHNPQLQLSPTAAAATAAAAAAAPCRKSSSTLATPRHSASRRGSAVARAGSSAAIDAPINKVINLIVMVQDGSSPVVAAALDKVLDILHQSTDLYSGEIANLQDDRVTSDYVGGLMASGPRLPEKKRHSVPAQRQNSASAMQSLRDTPDYLLPYLENDDNWNFDILALERVTDRRPMVHLAMRTLRRFQVCHYLQCSEDTMLRWLQVMQDHYRADNCYHNATHGADVMQCSAYFLSRDRVRLAFDETDEAASLLGALVHDLDHPGRTNPFLINCRHRLALLYNDISVLESHHVSLAFQLTTKDDRINIFKNMSTDDYKQLRQSIVDVVLATEMAKHFEHVGKFANQILAPLLAMEEEAEGEGGAASQPISEEEVQELLTRPENRSLIRRVLIKCSDVSNPCRPLKLCKEWARRISEEYFLQTDEEKSQGLPVVMPMFDRATCNMPKSQTSFIDFFLKEMFTVWHQFCDVPVLLENLNANYEYWKSLIDVDS
uniref:Phosphodiesterase n=1 Tax=Macrostomum lignano TaxID=282301 RepID=A0A1I8IGW6_9PLAT